MYKPKTFLQNANFCLAKNFVTQVKNSVRTKVTFILSLLADGGFCSVLKQELLYPCVETSPAVLVITDLRPEQYFRLVIKKQVYQLKKCLVVVKKHYFYFVSP